MRKSGYVSPLNRLGDLHERTSRFLGAVAARQEVDANYATEYTASFPQCLDFDLSQAGLLGLGLKL
jgi:hypothetical protein